MSTMTKPKLGTRAVIRAIDPGCAATCVACNQAVKFAAKVKAQQVICNVYVNRKWNRVEHFHLSCYVTSGSPHGHAAA